jgi:hypothetical protein
MKCRTTTRYSEQQDTNKNKILTRRNKEKQNNNNNKILITRRYKQ